MQVSYIDINVRVDKLIILALNSNGAFSGKLINGENVGALPMKVS